MDGCALIHPTHPLQPGDERLPDRSAPTDDKRRPAGDWPALPSMGEDQPSDAAEPALAGKLCRKLQLTHHQPQFADSHIQLYRRRQSHSLLAILLDLIAIE